MRPLSAGSLRPLPAALLLQGGPPARRATPPAQVQQLHAARLSRRSALPPGPAGGPQSTCRAPCKPTSSLRPWVPQSQDSPHLCRSPRRVFRTRAEQPRLPRSRPFLTWARPVTNVDRAVCVFLQGSGLRVTGQGPTCSCSAQKPSRIGRSAPPCSHSGASPPLTLDWMSCFCLQPPGTARQSGGPPE